MFFEERDRVHKTMARVVAAMGRARIAYALMGGMAVNAHGYRRTTGDVNLLVSLREFRKFVATYAEHGFERVPGHPRRFLDPLHEVTFDLLVAGRFPGN